MILGLDDWKFDVDIARTMAYSASEAAEHCTCAYCRNFYAAVDQDCPQLRPFLARFGIDVEAPDELMPYDIQDRMAYEGKYAVFGKIIQFGKDRISVGNASIWPMNDRNLDLPEPHFVLSLEELMLPWVMAEPLKDVVSPANEPSFLQEMWVRLLGRTGKQDLDS